MLSLSFLVSVFSFSNQKPSCTNPMSILYIAPMTDKKNHASYWDSGKENGNYYIILIIIIVGYMLGYILG